MIFSWCWIGHLPVSCNNEIEATGGKQLTEPWRCLAKSLLQIWLKNADWKSHVWIVCCCCFGLFWFLRQPRPTQVFFALSKCPHNGSGKPCMEASRNKSPGSGLDRTRMQIFNKLPAIRAASLMETTDAGEGKKKKSGRLWKNWVQDKGWRPGEERETLKWCLPWEGFFVPGKLDLWALTSS